MPWTQLRVRSGVHKSSTLLEADPGRYRPDYCPQCEVHHPLTAHGFYTRTLVDTAFDGTAAARRRRFNAGSIRSLVKFGSSALRLQRQRLSVDSSNDDNRTRAEEALRVSEQE